MLDEISEIEDYCEDQEIQAKEDKMTADYIQIMAKMGRDLNKGEDDVIDFIVNGLQPKIGEYVMEKSPTSIGAVLNHARFAESVRRKKPNDKTQSYTYGYSGRVLLLSNIAEHCMNSSKLQMVSYIYI